MRKVLIIGATSSIAECVARIFAERGDALVLVARDSEQLHSLSADLRLRGAGETHTEILDAAVRDGGLGALRRVIARHDRLDIALIAHGTLPDQPACENDPEALLRAIQINGISPVILASELAAQMAKQGNGTLAVITSVAGDRGRRSNFAYGSAKRLVSTFLQGLRSRYSQDGVHVVDIRPGPVDTPMTAHLEKGLLWTTPERVASRIVGAIDKSCSVLYTPFYWRWIMLVIRLIPERIFVKLNL